MNLNIVPIVPSKSGNTRQISPSKKWCFTYNVHMSVEELCQFEALCSDSSNKYVYQQEIGESGNYHLQGFIKFKRKVRPKSIFKNYPTIHWEKCRCEKEAILYCQKEDTRVSGTYPSYKGIIPHKPLKLISKDKFYPWQLEAMNLLNDDDDRTIYWMYESTGNVGKSSLVKYICAKLNGLVVSGKGADMKYGIVKYHEKNEGYPPIILIDIPRTVLDYVSYSAIEEIKNGCFFSGKYEGSMCIFNSPVIICFANEGPKVEKMSLDRWAIAEIINKELYWKRKKNISIS